MKSSTTCLLCNNQGKIKLSHTKAPYCNNCFIKYIEKRVRKDLRLGKYFKPNDTIYLFNDNTKEYFVTKFFLEEIFHKNLKIREIKKLDSVPDAGIIIVPTNLDRELNVKFIEFASNKLNNINKINETNKNSSNKTNETKITAEGNVVKLLRTVLEEEIIELCKLKKFPIRNYEPKNELIEKINKDFPETKFSMMNAFEEMDRIKQK